ncbi:Kunitz/Bovine pancreatic trypsin inhibitor domain protein [Ancylostoma ceylanicum]|uniref:Kunitz/Bovine pancreatic trypsin inhibitor domain protein n=1 Tax=Ancylostoma ceylanicum TaxID=53326 RepID=A0A0D6M049_9BILA|nr:Kunitz/Bovine pancreatic trypsin inhibitor domain protein [Ancylostoma ceylanicum]
MNDALPVFISKKEIRAQGACLDVFDQIYIEDCRHGEFSDRYFFNHNRKRCEHFHWGGCQSSSENFFVDMEQCRELCESPARELSQSCLEPFDDAYRGSCSRDGRYKQHFYFDQAVAYCTDEFDEKYKDSCEGGQWRERAYFDVGCAHLKFPLGYEPYERMPDPDTKYRCLLPKEIGKCKETYPFYHFDRSSKSCQPFSYSGCGGNENRFMTLSQCDGLCEPFIHMTDTEMDCYFPVDQGLGKNNKTCVENAGYRFHFHSELVCFRPPGDKGNCPGNANYTVKRWTYTAQLKCAQFTYSGCGGNENRFATQMDCELTCKGKKPSNNAALCSYDPDPGPCNQLRYMWFYNQTRGTCNQFLYGGCEGNSNRFESFEVCQKNCEVSGLDPCMEPLDRGNWCEAMSNRYYFNKRTRQCRGFHYTGCGKSGNNFLTKEECHEKCEKRYPRSVSVSPAADKRKKKPPSRPTGCKMPTFTQDEAVNTQEFMIADSGTKPMEKTSMIRHIILGGENRTYFKSDAEWVDYAFCLGYR